ncbi:MAG: hypothetical protein VXZ64_01125, partial [Candidatus Thermoplasmatota archaeon]|nr:hypothetical protein [Candidatus Thermoplasmatota archaeon]
MDGEVTAEQARELLDALVEGGGMALAQDFDGPALARAWEAAEEKGEGAVASAGGARRESRGRRFGLFAFHPGVGGNRLVARGLRLLCPRGQRAVAPWGSA